MPKGILQFDLPEEQTDFEIAVAAGRYVCAWEDLRNHLRSEVKHGPQPEVVKRAFEMVQAKMGEIFSEQGLLEL